MDYLVWLEAPEFRLSDETCFCSYDRFYGKLWPNKHLILGGGAEVKSVVFPIVIELYPISWPRNKRVPIIKNILEPQCMCMCVLEM